MAGVSVESGNGQRKSLDSNVNMVPMIDLLISVIAFLLMTAVWVQTGALSARVPTTVPSAPVTAPPEARYTIAVSPTGFRMGATAADLQQISADEHRFESLRAALSLRHHADGTLRMVQLQVDSAVPFQEIVQVMDTVYDVWGEGHGPRQSVRDMVSVQLL